MLRPPTRDDHPTHAYARSVADGLTPAGQWVRLAAQRHLTDLARGKERGLWFDDRAADLSFRFFGLLRLTKGKWGGKPFLLEPWQQFLVGSVFGWKRDDGTRRFREAHLEVARKNGKTETAGGTALKLLCADEEVSAEVYCLATKRDQAKTTYEAAFKLLRKSPLRKYVRPLKSAIHHEDSGSKLEPLGADADTLDSLNAHGAIKDELHAWKARDLWDVIDTSTGARAQPLGLTTTTAGFNRRSIWWERRELCVKLLEGRPGYADDSLFPLIYTLDDGDEWEDESTWHKANPNLGVTIRLGELREKAAEAKRTPGQVNAFRRLRLNQPTETATRWLDMARWRRAADPIPEDRLRGRVCFGGLDLSQTTDLTAWALCFPPAEGDRYWRFLVRHWLPAEDLDAREARDRVPYRRWAEGPGLDLCAGGWVDYELVRQQIERDREAFRLVTLAFDSKFAPAVVQQLMASGIDCHPQGQGFVGLNTGTKELFRLLLAGEVRHQGCPVLEWEAESAAVEQDAAGNQRPSKAKSTQRIDGIAAMVNALSIAIEKWGEGGPVEAGAVVLDFELL